jgi:acetyl esterase/lipase
VEDARSAVRWFRQNAARLGVDPDCIVAAGGSAGGHIAACTTLMPRADTKEESSQTSCKANALILFNPVLRFGPQLLKKVGNDEAVGQALSPVLHLTKDSPPTLLFYGTQDWLLRQGEEFLRRSKELGHRAELFTAEGQPHAFFHQSPWREKTLRRADEFLVSLGYLQGKPTIKVPDAGEVQPKAQPKGNLPPPTFENVRYGPHERHVLDFWQARSGRPTPVLVSIHGGGFVAGNKSVPPQLLKDCLSHKPSRRPPAVRYPPRCSRQTQPRPCGRLPRGQARGSGRLDLGRPEEGELSGKHTGLGAGGNGAGRRLPRPGGIAASAAAATGAPNGSPARAAGDATDRRNDTASSKHPSPSGPRLAGLPKAHAHAYFGLSMGRMRPA